MPNQEMCKDMVHICSCPCDHLLEECLQSCVGSSVLYFFVTFHLDLKRNCVTTISWYKQR
jgi:hypothetical protein